MSVVVLLTLKTKPNTYEEFGDILKNILGDTASFDGCEGIYVAGDQEDHTYLLFEKWASVENQKAYMKWRQERGDLDVFATVLREPPIVETRDLIFSS